MRRFIQAGLCMLALIPLALVYQAPTDVGTWALAIGFMAVVVIVWETARTADEQRRFGKERVQSRPKVITACVLALFSVCAVNVVENLVFSDFAEAAFWSLGMYAFWPRSLLSSEGGP